MYPKGIRDTARELAFQALYSMEISGNTLADLKGMDWYEDMARFDSEDGAIYEPGPDNRKELLGQAREILSGTVSSLAQIDTLIKEHLVKWDWSRVHPVDKSILRLSVYLLLYNPDVPHEVIISLANRLADSYSSDNASNYLNGILHQIKEKIRNPRAPEAAAPRRTIKLKTKPGSNRQG